MRADSDKKIKLPKFAIVFFCIAAVCLILYIIGIFYTPFADFFNTRNPLRKKRRGSEVIISRDSGPKPAHR